MTERRCENCDFFGPSFDSYSENQGTCRRMPPVECERTIFSQPQKSGSWNIRQGYKTKGAFYPEVSKTDFCGEFRPREHVADWRIPIGRI